jgi:hypothetical protein
MVARPTRSRVHAQLLKRTVRLCPGFGRINWSYVNWRGDKRDDHAGNLIFEKREMPFALKKT